MHVLYEFEYGSSNHDEVLWGYVTALQEVIELAYSTYFKSIIILPSSASSLQRLFYCVYLSLPLAQQINTELV